jgi:hypothetical protein
VALVACQQIIGFPDDILVGTGGSGGVGATSSASSARSASSSSSVGASSGGAGGAGSSSSTGGGSTSSTGGGGAGGVCTSGATQACYDGPAATRNVGACMDGTQTCAGNAWGPCLNATLPAIEDCTTTTIDESCDGEATCKGTCVWAHAYGDALGQFGNGVAVDPSGRLVVVGRAGGTIDFGNGPHPAQGTDAFVAVLDALGHEVWSQVYGDGAIQVAVAVDTDAAGNIVVGGVAAGSIDFGTGALTSPTGTNGFVAKLSPSGVGLWGRQLGNATLNVVAVRVGAGGDVFVAGEFTGSPDLGMGTISNNNNSTRAFVVRLAQADGHSVWAKSFGTSGIMAVHTATALELDGAGDVLVALSHVGPAVPPGGSAASCATTGGLVVKLGGSTGQTTWSWATCDATAGSVHVPSALGVDGANNVFVAGSFQGAITLVGAAQPSAGGYDAFLVELDPAGVPQFGKVFGDANNQRAMSLAVDHAGNVVLAGAQTGTVSFGGAPVVVTGTGAFLAKFDGAGAHLWSRGFSDSGSGIDNDLASLGYRALAAFPTGELAWATGFSGATDLGCGTITSQGTNDALVAVLAP